MIILFIITALVCSYYFVSLKGHVDIVTIAFFSNLLFFIPGFLGYTFIQVGDLKVYASDIAQKTYVVMILSMLSLIITSILLDKKLIIIKAGFREKPDSMVPLFINISILFSILCFVFVLQLTNFDIILEGEKEIIFSGNSLSKSFHSAFRYAAAFAFILSYISNKKSHFIISLFLLLVDIYCGFRSVASVSFISIFFFYFQGKRFSIAKYRKAAIVVLFCIFAMTSYKNFYHLIKEGKFSEIHQKITTENITERLISRLPSFNQISILNACIKEKFVIPKEHFKILIEIPFPFRITSGELITFNDRFQDYLFPNIPGGLAANPFAEFYSLNGFPSLILFLVLNAFVLLLFTFLYSKLNSQKYKMILVFCACFYAFYLNRSDLYRILLIMRRIIIYFFIINICVVAIAQVNWKITGKINQHG